MKICINERFRTKDHGEPPQGIASELNTSFLVTEFYEDLDQALLDCQMYNAFLGKTIYSVDLVKDYMLEEYSLCMLKTFWIAVFQRRWKKIYHQWKGSLPRALMRAQMNQGKWPPPILRRQYRNRIP